jgi:imidazoleglycerol-phosphate dehydratase
MSRIGKVERKTKEVDIKVEVNLDGKGTYEINTEVRFLNHLLESFATHSLFDLKVDVKGDLKHHIVEDCAIAIGNAIDEALRFREGIMRFGSAVVPMDEALAYCAIDLVKRPYSVIKLRLRDQIIEDMSKQDVAHFINSLAQASKCNIHLRVLYGKDDHHKAEAAIKALAIAFRRAVEFDKRREGVASSKGEMS